MNPSNEQVMNENVPLSPTRRSVPNLSVAAAGEKFRSPFFLWSTAIASIIPMVQLIIGSYYNGQCPIDQRISAYMIVAGACGLALVALSILLSVTFMCFVPESTPLTILASCGVCANMLATMIISVFVFIWFIIGCVWVFSIRSQVQFKDPKNLTTYCDPTLYKATFVLLIITIIWVIIQCCVGCFQGCFRMEKK